MKKILRMSLSLALSCTITLSNISLVVQAENIGNGNVIANLDNDKIIIGNDYIKREFSIIEGKILTSLIENNRANTKLIPQLGSEDFIINTIQKEESTIPEPILPKEVVERDNWTATLSTKNGTTYPDSDVKMLFDGDSNTYINKYEITGYPISLKIDLGEKKDISSFSYLKRPGYQDAAYGINGAMGKYQLYVSEDGDTWNEAGSGEFTRANYNLHQEGTLYNVGDVVYGNFDKTYTTRYVRVEQLSDGLGNTQEFTGAEINLFSDEYKVQEVSDGNSEIKSSDLIIDNSNSKIEDIEKGKKVTIAYEPYSLNNIKYTINMVTVLERDDHYIRSFLEIKTDNNMAQIDYIDLDHFVLSDEVKDTVWSHPDLKDVSSMWIGKNELMLGQPIYVNGMFFGSEFPATDTDVVNNEMQIRYYSGKTFKQLAIDNQLTTDGKFVSWQNVIGSAKGIDTDVVQTDFYEYISEIATPTEFRKQYNSWYDNMLGITDESIEKSFYGSEKGLTQNGIEPVDSYVVDDGWNNYRDPEFNSNISVSDAGESMNRTGFWEFNDKFPNELYTSTELTSKLQSKFGVWVGPQGGYNYFGGFAKYLEKMGTGYIQKDYWTNVCVGSDKYVKNLTNMFTDYQTRFDVDYWKIDGFAVRPCTDASHDHMTGGTNNMYYTTDLWEKWTDAWEEMRENRTAEGKELFINATCYVNLSPWILQWVNTVWVQDSGDTGEAGTGTRHQQKITYRDNVYYNLFKVNEVQFPLKNIYNHDPIYGVSDGSSASTEDFRDFLFVNAVRGTAFWELYYSPSIMDDEKWQVNADALDFAETNAHILEKAKLFGNRATNGVYGYSSWNGDEGIISFRNPTGEEQEFTLQLTDIVGVPKSVKNLKGNQVLPFVTDKVGEASYGDSINVTLAPYETRIIQYGKVDNEAAKVVSAKVTGDNEITIKYNERVENSESVYGIEGNTITESRLLDDYRTVVINTENTLLDNVILNINGERDGIGNTLTATLTIPRYDDAKIAYVKTGDDLVDGEKIKKKYNGNLNKYFLNLDKVYEIDTNKRFEGATDFAINMSVNTTSSGVNLFKQGDDVQISIDNEGYLDFKVKDLNVNSKSYITTVVEKAHGTFGTDEYVPTSIETNIIGKINDGKLHHIIAVREVNGMIKIYIDGELSNSVYNEKIINQSISGGRLEVADNNFDGILGEIEFRNSSIYYDEVKEIYSLYTKLPIIQYSREGWSVAACSEMSGTIGDGPALSSIDGNENTWWHTNYVGQDNHEGNHWISVDFGEEISFDTVNILSRGKGTNGTIKKYKLESNINGEWKVIKEGEFTDGNNDKIALEESITASGIRLTSISTFNGNNFAAIKEITVSQNDRLATAEEIKEVSKLVNEINESHYTIATVNRYKDIVSKVTSLDTINTQALITLKNELEVAYSSLLEAKELNELLKEVEMLDKEDYTIESWKVFENELVNAKAVVRNIEAKREDVDNAKIALETAKNELKEGVNFSELQRVIGIAEELIESDYTKESWARFTTELKAAKEVLTNSDVTQSEVDSAKTALENSINDLEVSSQGTIFVKHLEIAVEMAQAITEEDLKDVVPVVKIEFEEALKEAESILNSIKEGNKLTQEEINKYFDRLSKAMQMLEHKGNKTELIKLVEKINSLESKNFTTESWNALKDVLNSKDVQDVLNDENALEADIQRVYNGLNIAFSNLVVKPYINKDRLNNLISKVEELKKDDYIASTWKELQEILKEAKLVANSETSNQEKVDKAYTNLMKAYLDLRLKPSKDRLEDLISKVEELDSKKYTKKSWKALSKALKTAKTIFSKEDATEDEIEKAEKNIEIAMKNLELKNKGNNGNNNNGNNDVNNNENPNKNNELPNTGGMAATTLGLFGTIISVVGVFLLKKRNK